MLILNHFCGEQVNYVLKVTQESGEYVCKYRFASRHDGGGWGEFSFFSQTSKSMETQWNSVLMTKSLDVIVETIRNSKHPFRQVDNRPAKPQKSRYERRKVREYLRLGDWGGEQ